MNHQKPEVILLSDNFVFGDYGATRYIGPYVLASQLQESGIQTQVIDFFTCHENFFEYIKNFLSPSIQAIGISSTFLFPKEKSVLSKANRSESIGSYYSGELWFLEGKELLVWTEKFKKLIQTYNPNCKLVLGGVKAQFAHWRPEYYIHFDNVFFGAADESFVDYCLEIKKTNLQISKPDKFIYQKNSLKNQGLCPVCEYKLSWGISQGESLPIEISRGCLYNCKFCHYEKKKSDRKNVDNLKTELIRNYETYGTTVYHFCDDCFNDTRKKVEDVCNMFLSLPFKIEWVAYARVDVAVKFRETVDLMLESGARGLYWGIESFDYKTALAAGKGTHPDMVKQMFLETRDQFKNRCLNEASFIIGLPGEQKTSLDQTMDWLIENDVFDFVTFGPLGLMPYTENFDQLIFDYADYSRNPGKYGFTKIEFGEKKYWEHVQMNSIQAASVATDFSSQWKKHTKRSKIFGSIWVYPHLRTLGYSHNEIHSFLNQDIDHSQIKKQIKDRFRQFKENYFLAMIQ